MGFLIFLFVSAILIGRFLVNYRKPSCKQDRKTVVPYSVIGLIILLGEMIYSFAMTSVLSGILSIVQIILFCYLAVFVYVFSDSLHIQ